MSLIPTEVLLARQKREEAARIAGDESLRGLIVRANADNENLLRSIRTQTKLVREIRDEFTATLGDVTARTLYNETVRISDTAAIIERQDLFDVSLGEVRNGVSAVQASVEEYRVVAANATTAFAQVSTKLLSRVNDNVAAITQEATTRADEDSALAALITSLSSSLGVHTFVQSSAPTATGTGDLWFDSDDNNKLYRWSGSAWVAVDDVRIVTTEGNVTTLSSTVSTLSGTVSTLSTSVGSLTTSVSGLTGTVSTNSADITTLQSTVTSHTGSISTLSTSLGSLTTTVTGLSGTVSTNSADITTLQSTVTTQGTSISTLTTSVGVAQTTADAKVKTWVQGSAPTASATGDIWVDTSDGHKMKRWSGSAWVDTTVGDGAISAAVTSEQYARIAADGAIHARWGVAIDVNGRIAGRVNLDGTNQSSSFVVAVDKFVVENANGTITAMDIRTGGKIVFGADVQSDNFSAGSAGWRMERNSGNAEFNNVTVRGTLNADDIVAGTVTTTRLPTSVVNAALGSFGSGGTRASSSYGPLTAGTPIEVTVTCDGNLRKVVYSAAYLANATGGTMTCYLALYMDGSTLIAEFGGSSGVSLASSQQIPVEFSGLITPSAGSHTFQLYVKSSGGGSTATGGTISVE